MTRCHCGLLCLQCSGLAPPTPCQSPGARTVSHWTRQPSLDAQWLREDVRIAGTQALQLQHLYRALDFLETNKEALERAIYFRVADLLNLDVQVIFYDTTSLHFEVDEEDCGSGDDDVVKGSKAAGGKRYAAPRKRGNAIVAIAHKILKTVFLLIRRQTHYRDSAVDFEAMSVARNAPRWLKMLKKHGFLPAAA